MTGACPWSELAYAPASFCEASLCGWVRQPGNTWSNLGFLLAAAAIWRATRFRHRELRAMAWILVLMGVGSLFFHATETLVAKWLDWAGMYAMTAYMGAYVTARAFHPTPVGRLIAFAVLFGGGMSSLAIPGAPIRETFVILSLVCPLFEAILAARPRTRSPSYRWFWAAYLALAPAVVLWVLDQRRVLCVPDNHLLSGHATWHLLDALMFWCSFRYYAEVEGALEKVDARYPVG